MGFVLPQGFIRQKQYAELRQALADRYDRIELTALPDRIFQRAGLESAVIIATDLRDTGTKELPIHLRSVEVSDQSRTEFLSTGKVTAERRRTKIVRSGELWIGALEELWEYLEDYPVLGSCAELYRGLQWKSQSAGWSKRPREGFARGVLKPADSLVQFGIATTVFVDLRDESALYPGPLTRPWKEPKVLVNVARRSRGPWRLDACSGPIILRLQIIHWIVKHKGLSISPVST
ncbi:MAG: hypothetical protein ACOH2M_33065 [Cypionkella sp.]